jgi:hypothetical protein
MEFSLGQFFGDFFVFEACILIYVYIVHHAHISYRKTHHRDFKLDKEN